MAWSALFTAPTAFRAIKKEDPEGDFVPKYDLSKFRTLFLAGERADPGNRSNGRSRQLGVPVIDHWWQTETGWPMSQNPVGLGLLPVKYGSPGVPMPGYDLRVLDDAGHPGAARDARQRRGEAAAAARLSADAVECRRSASATPISRSSRASTRPPTPAIIDDDGYVFVMARTDDIINVAGHRLSTGAMEEVLAAHPDVAECAVIGIADAVKGQVPCGFVVLKAGVDREPGRSRARSSRWCASGSARSRRFKTVVTIKRLPKTRSGKILRATMRKIADEGSLEVPATIDDPAILDEIAAALSAAGAFGG